MSERCLFILNHSEARRRAIAAVQEAPDGFSVVLKPKGRSTSQNSVQWPYLNAFSEQLLWPVNGVRMRLEPEDWKDILTAAFHNESVRLAQGLDGKPVMLGQRTRRFSKAQFSEYIEFLKATAAERSVNVYEEEKPT